jgi:hypothetical protein
MPPITAILHTHNDGLRLGRALETLRPCDQILIIDHGSTDQTLRIAREYGANIHAAGPSSLDILHWARHDWLLCLLPTESLSESLEAALFEWKLYPPQDVSAVPACSAFACEETSDGWSEVTPTTRLVPKNWPRWDGVLPIYDANTMLLQGNLLRFRLP